MATGSWIAAVLFTIASCASAASSDMDPTWDPPGGYTTTNVGAGIEAEAKALAIDSVGRVVLGGYAYPVAGDYQFTAVRYYGDQTPQSTGFEDADFHNNVNNYPGIAFAPVGTNGAYGRALQIGVNDSVVMAGDCTTLEMPQNHAFCLTRFTNTGAIDGGFGSFGTVVTRIGPDDAYATAMAKDSTGAFLVAGYSSNPNPPNFPVFTVVRYSASGIQDMTFGVNGVARVADLSPGEARAYAIAVDTDDSIVVAGTVANAANPSFAFGVARLTAAGGSVPSFNSGNIAISGFPYGSNVTAVGIDALHRPVVGGAALPTSDPSATFTMALARFTTAGVLDSTFGTGGKVYNPLPICVDSTINGLAIDRSGRVFAAGTCKITDPVIAYELALVHYNGNGSFDSAYGTQGVDLQYFGSNAGLTSIVLDTLGRPVVAGSRVNGNSGFVVNRHDYVYSHGFE
jgi:uncharacterized delta-60 repeat protein